jgi:flagellar protein FlaG
MDVQKLSGLSAASTYSVPRPAPQAPEESNVKAATPPSTRGGSTLPQVELQLDIDPTTKTVIGRVVDKQTGKVVRQIPTEEMIALKERSAEVIALLDKKV